MANVRNIPTKTAPTDNSKLRQLANSKKKNAYNEYCESYDAYIDSVHKEMDKQQKKTEKEDSDIKKLTTAYEQEIDILKLRHSEQLTAYENKYYDVIVQKNELKQQLEISEQLLNSSNKDFKNCVYKETIQHILLNMSLYARANDCDFVVTENTPARVHFEFKESGFLLDVVISFENDEVYIFDSDEDKDATISIHQFIVFHSRFLSE